MHNIQIENLKTQNDINKISREECEKITGSGPISWVGAGIGGMSGGVSGAVYYPAGQAWKAAWGQPEWSWVEYGESIVEKAAAGAVIGGGVGTWIQNSFTGGPF